ncbi:MAG: aspartate kinase [Clostridia bacterium]|nr:aspartate kinase [Clostridia bacterium]
MALLVAKFGGSSLADANQFRKVKEIVMANPDRRYVVPSAPGKRFADDIKVTDMLYDCYELASEGLDFYESFDKIQGRFNGIIKDLGLDLDLSKEFSKIRSAFENAAGRDYAASRGEYLSGIILAKYLGYDFVDAAKCVRFNENGSFNAEFTFEKTAEHLSHHERAVIPGFYGKMPNDTIKTFSRGGSDITGSLVARGVGADLYENWTDVDGFLVADPRIVENPSPIKTITYRELRELSYMGATVLHEDAIFPVRQSGIPINIRNTNAPQNAGTMIVKDVTAEDETTHVTGIAGKKGFSIISIEKAMMNQELGFGRKVLGVIEKFGMSFENLPSGIDTMSVVLETKQINGRENELIEAIKTETNADSVAIEDKLAIIAVVGRGMIKACGTAAKVFAAIAKENINIRLMDQGSSELNIIIGVDESVFETALKSIYGEFFN